MTWNLYDFIDLRGQNVVTDWLGGLDGQLRARMRAKLMNIRTFGPGLPNMVTDTNESHIKEIVLNTKTLALRMFLCRGPTNPRTELTLLGGGQEKDRRYLSGSLTPADAEIYRQQLKQNPTARRRPHEFPEDNLG